MPTTQKSHGRHWISPESGFEESVKSRGSVAKAGKLEKEAYSAVIFAARRNRPSYS
jgi:hypothetical protein